MLLYSRKKVRYRRDGYCWKKRKDGKTTREDHMKLKVQGTEVRNVLTNPQLSQNAVAV
jgi:calmodulin-binding transcription activator